MEKKKKDEDGTVSAIRAVAAGLHAVADALRDSKREVFGRMAEGIRENTRGIEGAMLNSNITQKGGERTMATAQDVLDEIAAQKTIVGGLDVYNDDLRQRLKDALAAGQLVTAEQLDQIFADVKANNQAIADAMVENTTP